MYSKRMVKNCGFTFTEILVVLSIILVLACILLGVFSRVRASSRSSVCQSNLKQIAQAIQQYASDSGGYQPLAFGDTSNNDYSGYHGWAKRIQPYIHNTQVFQCPDAQRIRDEMDIIGTYTDYQYNPNLNGAQESQFTNPSSTVLTMDYDVQQDASRGLWLMSGSIRHLGGGNYSFLDGHVKWLKPRSVSRGRQSICESPNGSNYTFCFR